MRFRHRLHHRFHFDRPRRRRGRIACLEYKSLADILPGSQAQIVGFSPHMTPERHTHLLSYGLAPGCQVRVLQHNPVTIIQVEHTELALEGDLARLVQVIT